jgi:hypothetical protein
MSAVAVVPASASKSEYEKFNDCSYELPINGCIYGVAGPESFFQAGKVTVKFVHPITMSIGFIENEETEVLTVVPARDGHSISKTPEPAPSLTEGIDTELLPESEKVRYEKYLAAGKSTDVKATIELALPARDMILNEGNLLGEEGTALGFPVMIHLTNPFLGKKCYVGNTGEPIEVPFTTGATSPEPPNTPIHGFLGNIQVNGEGTILTLAEAKLVNNSYAAPGAKGCGANGSLDAAINAGLGLPSPAGSNTTELIGNLSQAGAARIREHISY